MDKGGHYEVEMKGWIAKGGIMMCKLKGWIDKGGHYDVEMKGGLVGWFVLFNDIWSQ